MTKIDFKTWTDAQLEMSPFPHAGIAAEISQRKKKNLWKKDGSTERIAKLIKDNR